MENYHDYHNPRGQLMSTDKIQMYAKSNKSDAVSCYAILYKKENNIYERNRKRLQGSMGCNQRFP